MYYPIYEACERHGLPLAIHPGTDGMGINHQPTPGYPDALHRVALSMSLAFQAHLVSLLTEGVFERFPGFASCWSRAAWRGCAPLMWRLDAEWKALRSEVPWVRQPPSEYLARPRAPGSAAARAPRRRPAPAGAPGDDGRQRLLMFASDYPHWDFDSPTRAFPRLPEPVHDAIFSGNARELYGL